MGEGFVIVISVLKVIGCIILGLLGLVLALLILILALPIGYRVQMDYKDSFLGKVSANWFFHLVSVTVSVQEQCCVKAYLFGIPIWKKEPQASEEMKDSQDAQKNASENETSENSQRDKTKNQMQSEELAQNTVPKIEAGQGHKHSNKAKKQRKRSFFTRLQGWLDKMEQLPDKIDDILSNWEKKLEHYLDTYIYYDNLLHKPGTEKVLLLLKSHGLAILKSLRIRSGKIDISIGTTEPQTYGRIMQLYAILSLLLPKNTRVDVQYVEDSYKEIHIKGRGLICIGYLVVHALAILLNKKFKKFISLLKREES